MRTLTALFIATLVIFTFTSPIATLTGSADVALAQQAQSAQIAPKEAVKISTPDPTPKQLSPLLGKWKYDTNQRFVSTFEMLSVSADGNGVVKDYKVNGRDVPNAKLVASNENGVIRVKIQLGEGAWELAYSTAFGGMLDGSFTPSGRAPISGKFYREK